jgi:hypothetical protein
LVALIAAGKLGFQEYVYRSAITEALINTYRQDAVERCQRESATRNLSIGYDAWSQPESIKLTVGHATLLAGALDGGNDEARAANPLIVLVARKTSAHLLCEFDVVRQSASVYQM